MINILLGLQVHLTIYYSDEEWERGNSLIINAAKEDGEVVYG